MGEKLLEGMKSIKFLGVTIDECLSWKIHYDLHVVLSKISKSLVVIRGMKQVSPPADMKGLYYALMVLRYGGKASTSIISRMNTYRKKLYDVLGRLII